MCGSRHLWFARKLGKGYGAQIRATDLLQMQQNGIAESRWPPLSAASRNGLAAEGFHLLRGLPLVSPQRFVCSCGVPLDLFPTESEPAIVAALSEGALCQTAQAKKCFWMDADELSGLGGICPAW